MSGSSLLEVPQQIALALTLASNVTGADFDYLAKTAARESSFRPAAASRTSSARGLFQFIDSTWLRTLKEEGGKYGLADLAKQIEKRPGGRYVVRDRAERRRIMKLRNNPTIAALMAGAFTRGNAEFLSEQLGRKPSGGELYIAHFLGASDAVRMIRLKRSSPHAPAVGHFARAARANRSIFYDGRRARSVREVYRRLVRIHARSGNVASKGWSTHVVRVDPDMLRLRPSTSRRYQKVAKALMEKKSGAVRLVVPAPARRPAAVTVPANASTLMPAPRVTSTALSLAVSGREAGSGRSPGAAPALAAANVFAGVTDLLRGSLMLPVDQQSKDRRILLSLGQP
ncbi:MAG: transglycosylase SLT domain-containing protein [Pseudomonadota bacterium]